ncbi:MAG: rRNA pseudouridine synthase [Magnetococcales bacterium]|nr:rRNA pseudouridine synthase [Magnetococcales bacterium]
MSESRSAKSRRRGGRKASESRPKRGGMRSGRSSRHSSSRQEVKPAAKSVESPQETPSDTGGWPTKIEAPKGEIRLQKWLAQAGLCSRREGERWIAEGRVAVNDETVNQQGIKVGPKDSVAVDGKPVYRPRRRKRTLLAFYKPRGVLCTRSDPKGRTTIFELLDPMLPRLINVGRLDYTTEGLLLLTDDGDLAHALMHPSSQVPRVYRVKVRGRMGDERLARIAQGVRLEDGPTGPLELKRDRIINTHTWLTITLREGRNRIVRRIFEHVDFPVARLIRTSYGGIDLGELPKGRWRPVTKEESEPLFRSLPSVDRGEKGS